MQQIVNAGAVTSFTETSSNTPVNYENCNRPYPPQTVTPHSTDSEISCAVYYSNCQEN
jgi:hypothetical protein